MTTQEIDALTSENLVAAVLTALTTAGIDPASLTVRPSEHFYTDQARVEILAGQEAITFWVTKAQWRTEDGYGPIRAQVLDDARKLWHSNDLARMAAKLATICGELNHAVQG